MLTAIHVATQPNRPALLAAAPTDPAGQAKLETDAAAYFNTLAQAEEARRYPYGRPEQDTGWYWEAPTWGNAP